MSARPDQAVPSGQDRPDGEPVPKAEAASFAPTRFGTLKHNITTHWKVEERAHGQ